MRETEPKLVPLDKINEPPHQLRLSFDSAALHALADDIGKHGLLQRIRVHFNPPDGRYTICAGHRRYLAMRLIGWTDAPAEVAPWCGDCTGVAAAENLQRADLTPLEEAAYLHKLRSTGYDVPGLAHLSRRSQEWVESRLALLQYPEDVRSAIHDHKLGLAVAAILAQIDHDGYREYLLRDALNNGATARTASVWLQHYHVERERLIINHEAVDAVAATRDRYRVLAPCDYCGDSDDLERTATWRLCSTCTTALRNAKAQPA